MGREDCFFERKMRSVRKRLRPLAYWLLKKKYRHVVIEQKGGLASQLGLYVVGEYLRRRYGHDVVYDLSWFEADGMDILGSSSRKWELENCFEIQVPHADPAEAATLKNWLPLKADNQFGSDSVLANAQAPFYWVSEMSSAEYKIKMADFLQSLKFKTAVVDAVREESEEIARWENSVCLHVRRGDFVGSVHDICGLGYYRRAIDFLLQKLPSRDGLKFFVFSNGFDWVKENILPLLPSGIPVQLMQKNDNDHMHGDFFLMSRCRHAVGANSGFYIWSTLLNPQAGAIVIEPDKIIRGVKNETVPEHYRIEVD
ncbi:MAG: alpha-1,2-fucosyltransferase [Opitutales bacterium]|nr:alpha-1,2-fucosyltransferase [Opitutales bacterium]